MVKYWMHLVYYDKNGAHVGESQIEILGAENDDDAVLKANQHVREMNELSNGPVRKSSSLSIQKRNLIRVTKEIFVNPFY